MVNYKDLGLVNSREMFKKAMEGKYAIPAFNFNNMEQMQAIVAACVETKSPVILQVSSGARKYANQTILRYMAQGAVEYAKELGCNIPICLHLDHGDTYELCVSCIEMGFSSVMIDGSALPYDENVALTKKVVDYAHKYDVTVEGELGVLAGIEDDVVAAASVYTSPDLVEDFVKKTGVDSLAKPDATVWLFLSEHLMVLTNSNRNNVPVMLTESSFLPHYVSTSWKKSKDVSPDSRSFSTDHLPYHKTKWLLSINMAVH